MADHNPLLISFNGCIFRILYLFCLTCITFSSLAKSYPGQVVLIIDDMGNKKQDIAAFRLNTAITYAILPHTPYAKHYADLAFLSKRDVILHVPMQSITAKKLGPGALTQEMNEQQIHRVLHQALKDVPNAIGINNHMGSLLTQQNDSMAWTMTFLKQHGLFVVDSKTSAKSVIAQQANKYGVINFHRNIFIDNDTTQLAMLKQFKRLISIAQRYQYAIGIAHPYPETLAFLKQYLPILPQHNVQLIPISKLLPQRPKQLVRNNELELSHQLALSTITSSN